MAKQGEDESEKEELARFEAAMKRPVLERIAKGVLYTYKPVLDDGPGVRVVDTMEDYRRWCETELPEWLGYRRVTDEEWQRIVDHALDD